MFHALLALFASERQRTCHASLGIMLVGQRVLLRPLSIKDCNAWLHLRNLSKDSLQKWEPLWPRDAAATAFYMRQWRRLMRRWIQDREYAFGLFQHDKAGGEGALVGGLTLTDIKRDVTQAATLGYWMGKPYMGQGLMREGAAILLDFAFDTLKLHRVEASCMPTNPQSLGLLQKLGFEKIGLARGYMKINGQWEDHELLQILPSPGHDKS